MTDPEPTPRVIFRGRRVRIVDHVGEVDLIDGVAFEDCQIIGPAVLIPTETVRIERCTFLVPDGLSLFWPFETKRQILSGGIHLVNTSFRGCTFDRIGMAVLAENLEAMAAGFGGGDAR